MPPRSKTPRSVCPLFSVPSIGPNSLLSLAGVTEPLAIFAVVTALARVCPCVTASLFSLLVVTTPFLIVLAITAPAPILALVMAPLPMLPGSTALGPSLPAITDFGASLPLVTAAFFEFLRGHGAALELLRADAVLRQAGGDGGAAEGDEERDRGDHVRVGELRRSLDFIGAVLLSVAFEPSFAASG